MDLRNALSLTMSGLVILALSIAISVVSLTAGNSSKEALTDAAKKQLSSTLVLQKKTIEQYFSDIRNQTTDLASQQNIIGALQTFASASNALKYDAGYQSTLGSANDGLKQYYSGSFGEVFKEKNSEGIDINPLFTEVDEIGHVLQQTYIANNPAPLGEKDALNVGGMDSAYDVAHGYYHPDLRHFIKTYGYYDLFLVDAQTNRVVYSVFKELDYATRLDTGPYRDSGLAKAYEQATKLSKGQAYLTDFNPYLPSYNDPTAFIATPIFNGDTRLGALVLQMRINRLNSAMTLNQQWRDVGLGATGETYLVGGDGKFRSEARGLIESPDTFVQNLQNQDPTALRAIETKRTSIRLLSADKMTLAALRGTGKGFMEGQNYLGRNVMSAYSPLDIENLQWSVVSEIETDEAIQASSHLSSSIRNTSIIIGIVVALLSLLIGRFFAGRIARPLRDGVDVAYQIASGRLSLSIDYVDNSRNEVEQLKKALSQMALKLSDTVTRIKQSAGTVDSSVKEFSHGNMDLARRTESQATTLESAAASIRELSHSAEDNAKSATDVDEVASRMNSVITDSQEAMNKVIETMADIRAESGKIVEVIDLVDEIAFQTNLLALNASVEAARAGDQGRGFAVVATEVRNLALRSSDAVRTIEKLVTDTNTRIDKGYSQINSVGKSNKHVLNDIKQVIAEVKKIAEASQKQAHDLARVNDSMREIDSITQENAALVEEAASSGVCLSNMAEELNRETEYFDLVSGETGYSKRTRQDA